MKKRFGIVLLLLLTLAIGCSSARVDATYVQRRLESMCEENSVLSFFPNPMYEYPVHITKELIDILDIENWSSSQSIVSQVDGSLMMLYCDLTDDADSKICRLAFFSDGAVLLQEYAEGKLSDSRQWYYNPVKGDQLFSALTDWVDANAML